MSTEPLFWYRPRTDGGYEGPLHNGQIGDVRKASGAWVPLFAGAAPVSAEPVGYVSKQAIERFQDGRHADIYPSIEELTHEFFDATPMALYAAPIASQAQPITPADAVYGLLAWLSCRDEVVTLSARHGAAIASDLANAFCEANGLQQFSPDYPENLKYPKSTLKQQPVSGADGLPTERVLIDGTAYELPAAVAAELLRLHLEILGAERERAAHAKQDADKVDAERWRALRAAATAKDNEFLNRVHGYLESTGLQYEDDPTEEQIDAAIDAARKEQA